MAKVTVPFEDICADVHAFMSVGQPEALGKLGGVPSIDVLRLGLRLINEEVNEEMLELLAEIITGEKTLSPENKALFLDHMVDSVYVIMWLANAMGFNKFGLFWDCWRDVQFANMDKFRDGVIRDAGGKIQKPAGWTAPDAMIKQRFFRALHLEYVTETPGVLATNDGRKALNGTTVHTAGGNG